MARWLERLRTSEAVTRQVHERLAERIGRELRGASAATIQQRITRAFEAFEGDRVRVLEGAIRAASAEGSGLSPQVARAVFGDAQAQRALTPVLTHHESVAQRRIGQEMYGETVRARLARRTGRLGRAMAAQVRESTALAETTEELSARVLSTRNVEVRLPRYIERVRAAAARAQPSAVRRTVRAQLEALESGRIPNHDISRETRRFLERVRRSNGEDIDEAVEQWVRGRAQNQAMTIARTEGQSALNESYVEQVGQQPWVVGVRWNLSPSHPDPDICDVMAAQDLHGLGAGGYPAADAPSLAHPNCLCFMSAIVDEHFLEREGARARGTAEPPRPWETAGDVSARDVLDGMTEEQRRSVLGSGRAREFARRPTRVVNPDGSFNPLYQIQGRPPPPLPSGERFEHRRNGEVVRLGARRRRAQR